MSTDTTWKHELRHIFDAMAKVDNHEASLKQGVAQVDAVLKRHRPDWIPRLEVVRSAARDVLTLPSHCCTANEMARAHQAFRAGLSSIVGSEPLVVERALADIAAADKAERAADIVTAASSKEPPMYTSMRGLLLLWEQGSITAEVVARGIEQRLRSETELEMVRRLHLQDEAHRDGSAARAMVALLVWLYTPEPTAYRFVEAEQESAEDAEPARSRQDEGYASDGEPSSEDFLEQEERALTALMDTDTKDADPLVDSGPKEPKGPYMSALDAIEVLESVPEPVSVDDIEEVLLDEKFLAHVGHMESRGYLVLREGCFRRHILLSEFEDFEFSGDHDSGYRGRFKRAEIMVLSHLAVEYGEMWFAGPTLQWRRYRIADPVGPFLDSVPLAPVARLTADDLLHEYGVERNSVCPHCKEPLPGHLGPTVGITKAANLRVCPGRLAAGLNRLLDSI